VTSNYTYDAIYQLTQTMQGTSTTESFSYDPVGNRTASLGVSSYTTNASNELTATSNASYTYDANGNTLTKTVGSNTTSYTWDYENRLTSVTLPGSGGTVTFKYDPMGRRIEKVSPTFTSIFAMDGDNLIETVNSSGAVVARYTQTQNIDEPLAELRASTTSYYESDGLGSVTSLTNAVGAVANTYTYDSYGNLTASSGSVSNPFSYTGREFDSETGLYYNRARYYDPTVGRFLGEDPVGFDGTYDFYSYVENTPINLRDPSGLQALPKPVPVAPKPPGPILVPDPIPVAAPSVIDAIVMFLKDILGPPAIILTSPEDLNPNEPDPGKSTCPSPRGPKDPCKGLRNQLADHQQRLQDYASDPYGNDNKSILGKGRDFEIIAGRVKSLIKQINDLKKQLEECERENGLR
jgi:RHS repeat-associated protein